MTQPTTRVYMLSAVSVDGRSTHVDYPSECAAIEAALAPGLAQSPPGTTAEIAADAITIRFAAGGSMQLPIIRGRHGVTIERAGRPMARITREEREVPIEPPALDLVWAREMPWSALQQAALEYAERVLPRHMYEIVLDVAHGDISPDDAPGKLGIRYRARPLEFNDDADNPDVVELTPQAIRADAHRARQLCGAWLGNPGYMAEHAVRKIDAAYQQRMNLLCGLVLAALEDRR